MRLLPDTLARRVMLLMALSLGAFHFGSIYLYQAGLQFAASSAREQQLSERLVSIRRSIAEQPPAKREEAAHGLSTASVDIHWSEISLVNEVVTTNRSVLEFKQRLLSAQLGELTEAQIRLGYADEGVANAYQGQNSHIMLVSLRLPDNSWVNYAITELPLPGQHGHGTLVSITIMAIGIILVSLLVVRMFNAPLRDLAAAAERLGRDLNAPGLPETGPQEVRIAARAFNLMQLRLRKLMADRVRTLAAISHDLRTPLTRLRLRAEFVGDEDIRERIERDVLEMQNLIDAALEYLRDESQIEPGALIDLVALLAELAEDFKAMGHKVTVSLPDKAEYIGRPITLRRAFSNLIDNGIKYGNQASITLEVKPDAYRISITDTGPGIPVESHQQVFEPFYRLEASRNTATGGTGLGMTIAHTAVTAHNGQIRLENLMQGGLLVEIILPRPAVS